MVIVGALVCGFAVGMAGLLNYFKYRSTAERLLQERLLTTGSAVEHSIQSSLALGLQFGDLGTLPETLERQRATDDLIVGIDIFDTEGHPLYSTDRLRTSRPVPASWLDSATKSGSQAWSVRDGRDAAVGMSIQNQFGLTVGHLALRYAADRVRDFELTVARELALAALVTFGGASAVAALAALAVMKRLRRDMSELETALRSSDPARPGSSVRQGPFAQALRRFVDTVRSAETQITELRAQLKGGGRR
jgi:hypothetical protein